VVVAFVVVVVGGDVVPTLVEDVVVTNVVEVAVAGTHCA
jgi:hypothetical protein